MVAGHTVSEFKKQTDSQTDMSALCSVLFIQSMTPTQGITPLTPRLGLTT